MRHVLTRHCDNVVSAVSKSRAQSDTQLFAATTCYMLICVAYQGSACLSDTVLHLKSSFHDCASTAASLVTSLMSPTACLYKASHCVSADCKQNYTLTSGLLGALIPSRSSLDAVLTDKCLYLHETCASEHKSR